MARPTHAKDKAPRKRRKMTDREKDSGIKEKKVQIDREKRISQAITQHAKASFLSKLNHITDNVMTPVDGCDLKPAANKETIIDNTVIPPNDLQTAAKETTVENNVIQSDDLKPAVNETTVENNVTPKDYLKPGANEAAEERIFLQPGALNTGAIIRKKTSVLTFISKNHFPLKYQDKSTGIESKGSDGITVDTNQNNALKPADDVFERTSSMISSSFEHYTLGATSGSSFGIEGLCKVVDTIYFLVLLLNLIKGNLFLRSYSR